jgi:cytochrome c-type biogenesis protein CcmH
MKGVTRSLAALIIVVALNGAMVSPAAAVQPDEILADPSLELRARGLSRELRCMVCQNQSIDDSDAPLARDLRLLVRERLKAGSTDQEVIDFLVARYGDFVLLNPRVTRHSIWLWLIPAGVMVAGGVAIFAIVRRRQTGAGVSGEPISELTGAEEKRLRMLIDQGSAPKDHLSI